jgi:hypothetical protein
MKNIVINYQESSKNLSSLLLSEKSLLKSLLIILFFILLSPLKSSAQDCSLVLTAKNNIESVNDEGRVYFITLQNNSSEAILLNLSVTNNNSGKNPDETSSIDNVKLNARILNTEGQEMTSKIKLVPKQLLEFQVKVTVPVGTPIKRWNNLLLKASTDKCNNYSASLILYTFIPNPEEK